MPPFRYMLLFPALIAGLVPPSAAAELALIPTASAVYIRRAEKIVCTLNLVDADKKARVHDAIAMHYQNVNVIDDAVVAQAKKLKQPAGVDKAAAAVAVQTMRDEAQLNLSKIHSEFIAQLARDLTPAQIDQVKDGLTYGVLPLTFRVYQQMLPNLTDEQKAQVLAWLTDAREYAIDAGSSEAKHAWFGKYKGKINNYLSKAGYDMKEAEKNLSKKS